MTTIDKEIQPTVVFADHSYMTETAMKTLESASKIIWIDIQGEDKLVSAIKASKPKVIVSEYCKITSRIMDSSPELMGIMVWGVGYDHVDLNAASEKGICVANTRGSNAESVAEHAIALMLALSRKLCQSDAFVRRGGWTSREETGLPSELAAFDLNSKVLGIIGLGTIGSRVAKVARTLGMPVLAYDCFLTVEQAAERGAELVNLDTLLKKSDFVTIHATLTSETRRMIGVRELEMMKPTAYLINTSRGAIIDEIALINALETRIAGAGLDVFDQEPLGPENPLARFSNVILTPHCAGNSKEALEATSWTVCEETMRMLNGQTPKNILNGAELVKRGFINPDPG